MKDDVRLLNGVMSPLAKSINKRVGAKPDGGFWKNCGDAVAVAAMHTNKTMVVFILVVGFFLFSCEFFKLLD